MMLSVILSISLVIQSTAAVSYYQGIGSKNIRPLSVYHASVSIKAASGPSLVKCIVEGTSYNGSIVNIEDEGRMLPYTSKIFSLKIPLIAPGAYRLQVQGRGGVNFVSYYPLRYLEKSFTVLVETDRAVYNPGSRIDFRTIILDSTLKPVDTDQTGPIVIRIVDANGDKIRVWKDVEAPRGVYSNGFRLSKHPVLGNWNITVTVRGQEYFKIIKVARYVIPRFRIDIDTKKHITFQDGVVTARIDTYYHHGDKVNGKVTISAFPTIFSRVIQPIFQSPVRKVYSTDGSLTVQFDIENELKLNDEYERNVIIDVTVEEKSTGMSENRSVVVHVHKSPYKLDLIKSSDFFKPALKYTAYVKVSRHDDEALDDAEITVRYGFSTIDEVPFEKTYRTNRRGIVKLEMMAPANISDTTALRIEAQLGDLKERISPVLPASSFSRNYLVASLETEKPLVDLDVEVSVTCTEPMDHISYVVFGRGDVVISKTIKVENKTNVLIKFRAVHAMVPLAHFVASYVRQDGEMIGDSLDIVIGGLLRNFLDIKSSTTESEPGLDLEFRMKAEPFSIVGLTAVDQESYMLGKENGLSESSIADEIVGYDGAVISDRLMRDDGFNFYWKPGGSNVHSGIQDSGGELITNARVLRRIPTLDDVYLRPKIYDSSTVKPDTGFGLSTVPVTRPPLAGPYAFSRIPVPVWNAPKVYLLDEIADTWIFSNFTMRPDGTLSTRRKLPNNIKTWRMSGFSLDPLHGLGLMSPTTYKTTKSLHVTTDLPYSLQKGETINIPVHVHNNANEDVIVDVTFHNMEGNFRFSTGPNEIAAPKTIENLKKKRESIKKNQNGTVWFMVTPIRTGRLEVKITITSPYSRDSLSRTFLVKAGGETEYYTKSELIDLRRDRHVNRSIRFDIPENVVPDSEKIQVACVGNIFGPTLRNLDMVIRKPTGCGEQNLLEMMTNLIVLQYLASTKTEAPEVHAKAVGHLEDAYQTQLSFKKNDGAFSLFGKNKDGGSVWITAYTLMAFRQASQFIYVDETVLEKGYEWLNQKQSQNGSFYEIAYEIHSDMQNKNGNSLALTSFVLISFLENQKFTSRYKNTINKGLDYIARYMDDKEETYSLALCAYALRISGHPSRQSAFNVLDSRANYTEEMRWWSKPKTDKNDPWNDRPRSVDVEMTSYSLLTFLENGLIEDSIPILNWLLKQQNDLYGFSSSQDTAIALQALYKLVLKLTAPTNLQIEYAYADKENGRFEIKSDDATIEQRQEIEKSSREVNFTARGEGLAFFKVHYQYNKDVTGPWPMFILDPQVDKISNSDHLQLSVCVRFVGKDEKSNMAVMEVDLPSGYVVDVHSLPSLEFSQNVQKVESKNEFNKVVLYFNNISSVVEYCPTISAFRTHRVADQRPVAVVIYDYYDTSRRARIFYKPLKTTICDICTDSDCENACIITPKPQIREEESSQKDGSVSVEATFISLYFFVIISLMC